MTDKKDKGNFRLGTAALAFVLTSLLTWVSFFFYFMKDEGQLDNDAFFLNLIADSFLVFRLPLHPIFWTLVQHNAILFFVTLFLNPILWSIVIERLVYWTKKGLKAI